MEKPFRLLVFASLVAVRLGLSQLQVLTKSLDSMGGITEGETG